MYPEIVTACAGLGVGVVVGMTGVGGGALMTPLLLLVFGIAPQTAVGTDLLFAAITKTAGAASHSVRGAVDWPIVRRLLWGSLPASTVLLLLHADAAARIDDRTIMIALGTALVLTSVATLLKNRVHELGARLRFGAPAGFKRVQPIATVLAGALLGVMVTLTSIGAGALGAVVLTCLYPMRLTPARLVGTDIAHAIPLALIAGAGYCAMGSVDVRLLAGMLVGSIPGVLLGARWSSTVGEGQLRVLLSLVLMFVGVRMML